MLRCLIRLNSAALIVVDGVLRDVEVGIAVTRGDISVNECGNGDARVIGDNGALTNKLYDNSRSGNDGVSHSSMLKMDMTVAVGESE